MCLAVYRRQQNREAIAIDGIIGSETVTAIVEFQRTNRLGADGRVDPGGRTITALQAVYENCVEPQLRSDMLSILESLATDLTRSRTPLPHAIETRVADIEALVRGLRGGTRGTDRNGGAGGFVRTFAPAIGAAAAIEAILITLMAMIAILLVIQMLPYAGRAIEDLLRRLHTLVARIVDIIRDAASEVEEFVRTNAQTGMRCSNDLTHFRELTTRVLNALTAPRSADPVSHHQTAIRTERLIREWWAALAALLACFERHGGGGTAA
jgi:hypothetical protein